MWDALSGHFPPWPRLCGFQYEQIWSLFFRPIKCRSVNRRVTHLLTKIIWNYETNIPIWWDVVCVLTDWGILPPVWMGDMVACKTSCDKQTTALVLWRTVVCQVPGSIPGSGMSSMASAHFVLNEVVYTYLSIETCLQRIFVSPSRLGGLWFCVYLSACYLHFSVVCT